MPYETMTYEELKTTREHIDMLMQKRRDDAVETFKQQAALMGFDLSMVAGNMNGIPMKYRDDQGNSWTGRGRKPAWVREAEEAGHDLEGFRV